MMRSIFAAIGILALGACATGYQPEGFSGGFSEVPVAADAYQISVKGNGYTSSAKVNEMALLRAAELAKTNGYNHFVILNLDQYERQSSYTTAGTSTTNTYGSATAYGSGNYATATGSATSYTTYNPGQTYNIVKPGVDVVVRFVPDEFAAEASALSVEQIYGMYAEKYGLIGKE
jgi:hypothetical protein